MIVGGPLLAATRAEVAAAASDPPGATFVPFLADFVDLLAADAVVTMGGDDTVREAVGLGKQPVIVPRVRADRPTSEQSIRAERLAALGLATVPRPTELPPLSLALAIRAQLDAGVSPPTILDFGGLDRAGQITTAFRR